MICAYYSWNSWTLKHGEGSGEMKNEESIASGDEIPKLIMSWSVGSVAYLFNAESYQMDLAVGKAYMRMIYLNLQTLI